MNQTPLITSVRTFALAVPLERPPEDSHASLTHWVVPVVEISTDDGVVGTGISGIHTGAELICDVIDNYYTPQLIGRPATDQRRIWHELYWSPIQWIGRSGITHLALGMIDIALWDLAARSANQPLWRLLGGHHERLATYNTDVGWLNRDMPELVEGARQAVDDGWRAVKLKVGKPDWREDVARLTAVRAAIGDGVGLYIDANKMWDLPTARRLLRALEDIEVGWIEEPLHPDDVRGHAQLQADTHIPIALGESLYSRYDFRNFIDADAVRVVQVDVTRVGGVTEYLEVQALANSAGLPIVPHAGDMMVLHQHLAAANFARTPATIEYIPWTLGVYEQPVRLVGPEVQLPTESGASTAIAPAAKRDWGIPGIGTDDSA